MSLYVGRSDSRMDKKLKLLIISAIRFLASLICSGVEGMGLGLLYTGNLFMTRVSFFVVVHAKNCSCIALVVSKNVLIYGMIFVIIKKSVRCGFQEEGV